MCCQVIIQPNFALQVLGLVHVRTAAQAQDTWQWGRESILVGCSLPVCTVLSTVVLALEAG